MGPFFLKIKEGQKGCGHIRKCFTGVKRAAFSAADRKERHLSRVRSVPRTSDRAVACRDDDKIFGINLRQEPAKPFVEFSKRRRKPVQVTTRTVQRVEIGEMGKTRPSRMPCQIRSMVPFLTIRFHGMRAGDSAAAENSTDLPDALHARPSSKWHSKWCVAAEADNHAARRSGKVAGAAGERPGDDASIR